MSDEEMTTPATSDKVGFRDIYRAVNESEVRIVARIDTALLTITGAVADHEQRIRKLESETATDAREAKAGLTKANVRIDMMDDVVQSFVNREKGIFQTLSSAQKIILLIFSFFGFFAVFMDIFSKYFGSATP